MAISMKPGKARADAWAAKRKAAKLADKEGVLAEEEGKCTTRSKAKAKAKAKLTLKPKPKPKPKTVQLTDVKSDLDQVSRKVDGTTSVVHKLVSGQKVTARTLELHDDRLDESDRKHRNVRVVLCILLPLVAGLVYERADSLKSLLSSFFVM